MKEPKMKTYYLDVNLGYKLDVNLGYKLDGNPGYKEVTSSRRASGLQLMAEAFGTTWQALAETIGKRPVRVTAEQLGNYIAARDMAGIGNAVVGLNIRTTPDNVLDFTGTQPHDPIQMGLFCSSNGGKTDKT